MNKGCNFSSSTFPPPGAPATSTNAGAGSTDRFALCRVDGGLVAAGDCKIVVLPRGTRGDCAVAEARVVPPPIPEDELVNEQFGNPRVGRWVLIHQVLECECADGWLALVHLTA